MPQVLDASSLNADDDSLDNFNRLCHGVWTEFKLYRWRVWLSSDALDTSLIVVVQAFRRILMIVL